MGGLGVQDVAGKDGVFQVDGVQQRGGRGDFVALESICRWARTTPWWSIAASSWTAVAVAVRDPWTVLPSTAIARSAGLTGCSDGCKAGALAWRNAPIAVSSA